MAGAEVPAPHTLYMRSPEDIKQAAEVFDEMVERIIGSSPAADHLRTALPFDFAASAFHWVLQDGHPRCIEFEQRISRLLELDSRQGKIRTGDTGPVN